MHSQKRRQQHAEARARIQNSLKNMRLHSQKKSPSNSEECIIINHVPQERSVDETAERERTMKEVIEFANKKYGTLLNEVIRKKKRDPERQALERFFTPFVTLETEAMKSIKQKLDHYASNMKENKTPLEILRFQNRK